MKCESCIFYNLEYDEHRQKWDDALLDTAQEVQNHFCPLFDDPVDPEIINGKKPCKFYINKKG